MDLKYLHAFAVLLGFFIVSASRRFQCAGLIIAVFCVV